MAESRKRPSMKRGARELEEEGYPALGTVLSSKYRLDQVIGAGGMGAVYLSENVTTGRKVAVKILARNYLSNPEMFARFQQEARAASSIRHKGVCDVIDMGTAEDGTAFIVLEYLQGETLKAKLDRDGRMPAADSARIVADVLDVMAAAHEQRVIHRDLKPENVFLVDRPVSMVKVVDFGLSKFRDTNLTSAGRIFGTPSYMAPEQAQSTKTVGPAADLYAIGAIFFHLLAGRPPFVGNSQVEIVTQLLSQPAPKLRTIRSDAPEPLAKIVDALLEGDPTKRPSDARQVREQVLAAMRALPSEANRGARTVAATPAAMAPQQAQPMVSWDSQPLDRSSRGTELAVPALGSDPGELTSTQALTQIGGPGSGKSKRQMILLGAAIAGVFVFGAVAGMLLFGRRAPVSNEVPDEDTVVIQESSLQRAPATGAAAGEKVTTHIRVTKPTENVTCATYGGTQAKGPDCTFQGTKGADDFVVISAPGYTRKMVQITYGATVDPVQLDAKP